MSFTEESSNVKIEACVRVWGRVRVLNESMNTSVRMGVHLCWNVRSGPEHLPHCIVPAAVGSSSTVMPLSKSIARSGWTLRILSELKKLSRCEISVFVCVCVCECLCVF